MSASYAVISASFWDIRLARKPPLPRHPFLPPPKAPAPTQAVPYTLPHTPLSSGTPQASVCPTRKSFHILGAVKHLPKRFGCQHRFKVKIISSLIHIFNSGFHALILRFFLRNRRIKFRLCLDDLRFLLRYHLLNLCNFRLYFREIDIQLRDIRRKVFLDFSSSFIMDFTSVSPDWSFFSDSPHPLSHSASAQCSFLNLIRCQPDTQKGACPQTWQPPVL